MKKILIPLLTLCSLFCKGQISISNDESTTGFIYSPGIQWTENSKQDSIVKIIIEGDTMRAVRNLLEYCTQENNENDNASIILSMINLNYLKKMFGSKEFNFYLKEYRKEVAKNKKARLKKFGDSMNPKIIE